MPMTPAEAEAIARYQAKTYKKLNIALRIDDDADVIKSWQEAQQKRISSREWLRDLYEQARKNK